MGLFSFDSPEEKAQKAAKKMALDNFPIYFTAAVDFDYKIVHGGIYSWCINNDFKKAHNYVLDQIKESAFNCGADAIIDVKFNITEGNNNCMEGTGTPYSVVHATGVAVKRK